LRRVGATVGSISVGLRHVGALIGGIGFRGSSLQSHGFALLGKTLALMTASWLSASARAIEIFRSAMNSRWATRTLSISGFSAAVTAMLACSIASGARLPNCGSDCNSVRRARSAAAPSGSTGVLAQAVSSTAATAAAIRVWRLEIKAFIA
jgi:hypothetical protein